jgi:hypothetical protein
MERQMNGTRKVCLPEDLCRAAEEKFGARFSSVDELVCNLLTALLKDDGSQMDSREIEVVEQRLRGLGYV